jgi:hypothetical protein
MAILVVALTLLAVGENGVGFGGFLEASLGVFVTLILIGVVRQRELAIGLFDLGIRRLALDTEDFVIVALV